MKKLLFQQNIHYIIFLFVIITYLFSCTNHEKEYTNSFYKMEHVQDDPIVDFNIIDCVNESNQKIIELSNTLAKSAKNIEALQLSLKIKRDHQKIDFELNKLTKENLILLSNISNNSINGKKPDLYLFKAIETETKKQIILFDSIEKKTQNIDFKKFAVLSKALMKNNNDALKTLLNN